MKILNVALALITVGAFSTAACTVTTTGGTSVTDAGVDSGKDSSAGKTDSGTATDAGNTASDCPSSALDSASSADVAAHRAAGMAAPVLNACTAAELTAVYNAFWDGYSTDDFSDFAASVSAKCGSCVFATQDSGPIRPMTVLLSEDIGWLDMYSACMSKKTSNPMCGSAAVSRELCSLYACTCDTATDAEYAACSDDTFSSTTGLCAAEIAAYKTNCGTTDTAAETALSNFCYPPESAEDAQVETFDISVLNYLCGTGTDPHL